MNPDARDKPDPERLRKLRKWDGIQWHATDQFGWAQPSMYDVIGKQGRTKLDGLERLHDYQVSVSFPGADFQKGEEGHRSDLTDHTGKVIASSGTEMAEAVQEWLVKDWLDSDESLGLTHAFVCSLNLKYCEGSVKAQNFRYYSTSKQAPATAVINENWAVYLEESFLEAHVIVFIVNQDWLDSIACNQEFEAMITRKMKFRPKVCIRDAIILLDITDEKFNTRWGGKLPQIYMLKLCAHELTANTKKHCINLNMRKPNNKFKKGMVHEARKHFDTYEITYNNQSTDVQKRDGRARFVDIVRSYCMKHETPSNLVMKNCMENAHRIDWPRWLYFRVLSGTGGWEQLAELRDCELPATRPVHAAHLKASKDIASRRFRVRMMGVTGDMYNQGYKIMMGEPLLINKASGENIIGCGKGYYKMAGERLGMLGFQHWCGSKQFSFFEWLVPDHMPAVVVSEAVICANVRHCVLEAMPEALWPTHRDGLASYQPLTFPATDKKDAPGSYQQVLGQAGTAVSVMPPKWVPLHKVISHVWTTPEIPGENSASFLLPEASPQCNQFRLLITDSDAGKKPQNIAFSLQLETCLPAGLYPIGGGTVSGSGGDAVGEDAPPALAFDGSRETRWLDVCGGGMGNTAVFEYKHTKPVKVLKYKVTSQINALASYHSGLSGAPRDWTLQAENDSGVWIQVDCRVEIYFKTHLETQEFLVADPICSKSYRLTFTAVAAGCSSRSLQVGNIQFLVEMQKTKTFLQQHQIITASSAYDAHNHELSRLWKSKDCLSIQMPVHSKSMAALKGGQVAWNTAPGGVNAWYDWPLDFVLKPEQDLDGSIVTQRTRCTRPRKGVVLMDGTIKSGFRRSYKENEASLCYKHTRPVVLKGYGFGSCENYVRADPQDWNLEGQLENGAWILLHHVEKFNFQDRSEGMTFFLPANSQLCASHRLVFTRINAMASLLHLDNLHFLVECCTTEAADEADMLPLIHDEIAHVSLKVKECECEGGKASITRYLIHKEATSLLDSRATPVSWVLEGFTSDY